MIKESLRKLINRVPFLKKNRLYYHIQRYRQYSPCKVDKSLTTRLDIIDDLVKDGIVIIPDYLSKSICDQIVSELEPCVTKVLDGTFEGIYSKNQLDQKAFRIGKVNEYSSTADRHFFNDNVINSIAKSYVSKKAFSYRKEADYKLEAGHLLQADLPHFDDWRHRFKAFLYLTDVNEKNAPFVYYKGSHEQHPWKYKYHLEFEKYGETGRYGHFFIQEMNKIENDRNYKKLVCIGKAGTLILADFRGIHKGTTLLEGKRILLNNTYGI